MNHKITSDDLGSVVNLIEGKTVVVSVPKGLALVGLPNNNGDLLLSLCYGDYKLEQVASTLEKEPVYDFNGCEHQVYDFEEEYWEYDRSLRAAGLLRYNS